jgi:putative FmdB family regulatory protein
MPIYEYVCKSCEKEVEILVKSINTKTVYCPECGSDKLDKQWSVPGLLKGSGSSFDEMPCGHSGESCNMPSCPAKNGHMCGM